MSIANNASRKNQTWTNQKLIALSRHLGQGYCSGLHTTTQGDRRADTWTTEKFINLSKNLSSAYGVDF